MSDNVIIEIIGGINAVLSIIGSIFVNKLTAKQQRDSEVRMIKQQWYNNFLEAFSKKISYANNGVEVPEEINAKFCEEFNRLPLYASEEVIECINLLNKNSDRPIFELYKVIRNDLCESKYKEFKKVSEFSFQIYEIPNKK